MCRIFPRKEDGWKVGGSLDVKTYRYALDEDTLAEGHQHKDGRLLSLGH